MEEWNEYGELQQNVGTSPIVPSSSTPSAPSTPSKASKTVDTPSTAQPLAATSSRPPPSSTTESPRITAIRQAGFEAAKKAGDAKSQARVKAFGEFKAFDDAAKKLDHSAPTGMPPPSGTTEASSAVAPETGSTAVKSKADTVPLTVAGEGEKMQKSRNYMGRYPKTGETHNKKSGDSSLEEVEDDEDIKPNISPTKRSDTEVEISKEEDEPKTVTGSATPKSTTDKRDIDIVKVLKEQGKTGGPILDHTKLKNQTTAAATDEAHPPPGKNIQNQAAASPKEVGESVGD